MTCPSRKVPFTSYYQARKHLASVIAKNRFKGKPHESRNMCVYRCKFCHGYHVGHADSKRVAVTIKRMKMEKFKIREDD